MKPLVALARADQQFLTTARSITSDDWASPTPCDEWTVRDLVNHVASGSASCAAALTGASLDEVVAIRSRDQLGADPFATLASNLAAQEAAFADAPPDLRVLYFNTGVPTDVAFLIRQRASDALIHTWDLARAIGADETLDEELVELAWSQFSGNIGEEQLRSTGVFGQSASGAIGPDASPTERLLDLTGRRP